MKKLPIDVEDYKEASASFYVDKTLIIKDIIDLFFGRSVLVCRPRRFGKSLTLSMIDYYFNRDRDSAALFIGKKIASCDKGSLGPARLSRLAEKAILQAQEKDYGQDLHRMGCRRILTYGIVFDDRSHAIALHQEELP